MIPRTIYSALENRLFKGKILLLYGARQTGKTTLVKRLLRHHSGAYYNCDEPDIRQKFENQSSSALKRLVGNNVLVVLDEAQRVQNIALTLKLLVDTYPEIQVVATGSSSFELADRLKEPLTGRKFEFHLFPLSLAEWETAHGPLETDRILSRATITGLYPEPALQSDDEARETLMELAGSALYKDILLLGAIRNPEALEKLLRALALQIGQEVSYPEIGSMIGLDKNTVETYIRVLEQAFILFRLRPFSRNLRNEIKKLRKVYFWDNGIRNALINNFAPLDTRTDAGALWENFVIAERMKQLRNQRSHNASWFWRTHQQQEIDYLEQRATDLLAVEIKTRSGRGRIPTTFQRAYPEATPLVITPDNWRAFIFAPA